MFPICVLLVYLALAAQYESLFLPLAIILILPMTVLSAMTGVWLTGSDNNIFTQIGLFVLIGLASKNAILIVEFARELEAQGKTTAAAVARRRTIRDMTVMRSSNCPAQDTAAFDCCTMPRYSPIAGRDSPR